MLIPLTALWLPILLSAALAFIASALVWTVVGHHKTDFKQVPDEDNVLAAMRTGGLAPGSYFFPHAKDRGEMDTPEHKAKMEEGPVGTMVVMQPGPPAMGKSMALQFVFFLLASVSDRIRGRREPGARNPVPDRVSSHRHRGDPRLRRVARSPVDLVRPTVGTHVQGDCRRDRLRASDRRRFQFDVAAVSSPSRSSPGRCAEERPRLGLIAAHEGSVTRPESRLDHSGLLCRNLTIS